MTSFGDAWREAGMVDVNFQPTAGTYNVNVIDASAFAGRDGREWAKVVLQIIGTDAAGRQFDHFMNLNNPTGLRIAREALITYGLESPETVEDLDDLSRQMFELVGTQAEVTVGFKDGFMNVRVLGSRTDATDIPVDNGGPPSPVNPAQESFASAASRNNDDDADDIPF